VTRREHLSARRCHRECVSRPWNGGCEVGDGKLVIKKRGSGCSMVLCHSFVKGDSYPKICAPRDVEGEGFSFAVAEASPETGAGAGFICGRWSGQLGQLVD
jgi:hypothetical protein